MVQKALQEKSAYWHSVWQFFRLHKHRDSGDGTDGKMEVFRARVENARALLAFGITEGRGYKKGESQLTPELIEQIIQAEELLHRNEPPSWQQRADFEKAYWLLARSLTPVSASVLEIPRWQQPKWFWSAMTIIYFFSAFCWFWAFNDHRVYMKLKAMDSIAVVLLFALLNTATVGFIWRFSHWFTGVVTRQKLNRIIAFCYGFTLLAMLSPLLITIIILSFPAGLFRIIALESPIGVSLACSLPLPGEKEEGIPVDLRCDEKKPHYQWVLNIGGVPGPQIWQKGHEPEVDWRRPRVQIRGGLVVPIYIIVLAFIGGAVSMTRRVPEYQRRAADPYDLMTPETARELLIFQIMQLISAPLIAVAIYHILAPASRATAIILGFASGFASEPILLGIRALAEKLQPPSPEYTDIHGASVHVAKDGRGVERGRSTANRDHDTAMQPGVATFVRGTTAASAGSKETRQEGT